MKKDIDYIEQMSILINGAFEKEKEENGSVNITFLKSKKLKNLTVSTMKALELVGFTVLEEEKFNKLYKIAIRECKAKNKFGMTPSISLRKDQKKSWLTNNVIKKVHWNNEQEIKTYRDRYMKYLENLGRSKKYVDETKRSSLEILKKMGNPDSRSPFFIRGLVVGSVQSGKTANFNAVINSAIDVGYSLIIVLSGIMEDLRKQTQQRIEKEVEGKHTSNNTFIGVGAISSFGELGTYKKVRQIIVPTSLDTDFKRTMRDTDFSLNNKNILICKKNTSVLKNLILWLDTYLKDKEKMKLPLLIIDDEADNASLNNLGHKGVEEASTINGHIRALLALFHKKTYLGYTATPFSNILQDRNEAPDKKWIIKDRGVDKEFDQEASLFPHDFIELLFPPTNYIGAKHYFQTKLAEVKQIDPLIVTVKDSLNAFPSRVNSETNEPTVLTIKGTRATKKDDLFPTYIPESLKDAVYCFVISTAIRISRKSEMLNSKFYQPHNTMLIHISRFTTWQNRTRDLVENFIKETDEKLSNDLPSSPDSIYAKFESIWYKYYAYIMENIKDYLSNEYEDEYLVSKTFSEIKELLITAVKDIEIKAVNSVTKDSLIYPNNTEKKYIAIGGNRLSRGFTLEGLTINYFVRKTNTADTLLQMGRWFGYRPGYIDCCKLFATKEGLDKFDQTSLIIEDLEQRFIDMNRDPNNTPDKYALRVLNNPDVIKLTRPSILKNAEEISWSYSDSLIQTTKFSIDRDRINNSWKDLKNLFTKFNFIENKKYLEYKIKNINELFSFLELPNSFYDTSQTEEIDYFKNLKLFIKLANKKDKLTHWSIIIRISGRGKVIKKENSGLPLDIYKSVRSGHKEGRWFNELKDNKMFAAGGNSSNILGGGDDFKIRLDHKVIEKAEIDFKKYRYEYLEKKYPNLSKIEIDEKMKKIKAPEKVFRQKMTEDEAVLVIYLMDLDKIFKDSKGNEILELNYLKNSVDLNIPLIGFAIGIPELTGDIGGTYMQSKFHINDSELVGDYDFDELKEELE